MRKAVLSLILKAGDYTNVPWKTLLGISISSLFMPNHGSCSLVYCELGIFFPLCVKALPGSGAAAPGPSCPAAGTAAACYSRKTAVLMALEVCHFTVPYLFLI